HPPPLSTLFPYTTLFRSLFGDDRRLTRRAQGGRGLPAARPVVPGRASGLHAERRRRPGRVVAAAAGGEPSRNRRARDLPRYGLRSEEHTSELQSHLNLVC